MKQPYELLIDYYKEKHGLDYTEEINHLIMTRDYYIDRLEKGKYLSKKDRNNMINLLELLADPVDHRPCNKK